MVVKIELVVPAAAVKGDGWMSVTLTVDEDKQLTIAKYAEPWQL